MKESFYFPHDYNAQRDPKMAKLLRAHGWEAYGIFWALIERIYEQGGRLSEDYDMLAYELRTDIAKVQAIINKFELFIVEDGLIGSASVDRRMDERRERMEEGKKNAAKRWGANGGPMGTQCDPNAIKERKETKETNIGTPAANLPVKFSIPSIEDVKAYCLERKNTVDPGKWYDFYLSKGWAIGKNKMKDWKAAVRTWENNDYGRTENARKPKSDIYI